MHVLLARCQAPVRTASLTPATYGKVQVGNSQNQWIAKLRFAAAALGIFYWFETLFFWSMPVWEREKPLGSPYTFGYDNCKFGTTLSVAGARSLAPLQDSQAPPLGRLLSRAQSALDPCCAGLFGQALQASGHCCGRRRRMDFGAPDESRCVCSLPQASYPCSPCRCQSQVSRNLSDKAWASFPLPLFPLL